MGAVVEDNLAVDCAAGVDAGAVDVERQIEAKGEVGENPCVEAEFEGQVEFERALGPGEAFEVKVGARAQLRPEQKTTEAKAGFSLEIGNDRLR